MPEYNDRHDDPAHPISVARRLLDDHRQLRWCLDMHVIEPSFDPTTLTKHRQRWLAHALGQRLFDEVVVQADAPRLLSDAPFTVDGTLIEAAASRKRFRPREGEPPARPDNPGHPTVNCHGERRSNAIQQSPTDPDARLLQPGRGQEA